MLGAWITLVDGRCDAGLVDQFLDCSGQEVANSDTKSRSE